MSLFSNIFAQTTDSIIADITSKVKALRSIAAAHKANSDVHTQLAAEHTELAPGAQAEHERATNIASKFEALVSG